MRAVGDEPLELGDEQLAALADRARGDHIVGQGRLRSRIVETQRREPAQVRARPVAVVARKAQVAAQEELRQAVARTHLVLARILDRAHEVAEALLLERRQVREAQLAGGQQAAKALGITAVGLDAVGWPPRDLPGRDHTQVDPALGGGTGEAEAGRPRLIDGVDARAELGEELERLERRALDAAEAQLAGEWFEDRRLGHVGVDLERRERRNTVGQGRHLP
jgi:hypothetical protein